MHENQTKLTSYICGAFI